MVLRKQLRNNEPVNSDLLLWTKFYLTFMNDVINL